MGVERIENGFAKSVSWGYTICATVCLLFAGCYAPLYSHGIPARSLSNEFRLPLRTSAASLNYSNLVGPGSTAYRLGPGDRLAVMVPDLIAKGNVQSFQIQVLDTGEISLPRLNQSIPVGGLTLAEAQQYVNTALAEGLLQNPGAIVSLVEKGTVNILVLGAVELPGVHALPRYENDVAHALAAAQGFAEDAGDYIEIHRRHQSIETAPVPSPASAPVNTPKQQTNSPTASIVPAPSQQPTMSDHVTSGFRIDQPDPPQQPIDSDSQATRPGLMRDLVPDSIQSGTPSPQHLPGHVLPVIRGQSPAVDSILQPNVTHDSAGTIIKIPLRGDNSFLNPDDVILNAGDVVIVPRKTDKVFYVVGPLSDQNRLRFSVGDRDRQIGNGLLLPDDREIDVVTAVAMAGYIDPISSPTTVTVHRVRPDGTPLLVRVDLIAARSDPQETILVEAGDIIYLNPDFDWYSRRTFDRIIDRALGTAVGRFLTK